MTPAKVLLADEKKLEKAIFGKGGLRATFEGAAGIKAKSGELAKLADGWRALVYTNKKAIEALQAEEATLGAKDPRLAEVKSELTALRAERVELLQQAVDAGARLEQLAWGLADDRGWTRASYAASSRKAALETSKQLLWNLRDAIAVEQSSPVAGDHSALGLKSLAQADLDAQRALGAAELHLKTHRAQLGSARSNDAFRLDVLEAARDTLGVLLEGAVVDAETARAAVLGDPSAELAVEDARIAAMAALGLDPLDPAYADTALVELIVWRAQLGSDTAKMMLTDLQDRMAGAIDTASELMKSAKATPKQLEALNTIGALVKQYNFAADDLSTFDLSALEAKFVEQLAAAGLYGIVPKTETEKMQALHDRAGDFTLLTDLAAGVVDPKGEADRDRGTAISLAQTKAMSDPGATYAVVVEAGKKGPLYRVRKLEGAELDEGVVYVAQKSGPGLKIKDQFSDFSAEKEVVDAFRPAASGGSAVTQKLSAAATSELYATIYGKASKEVAARYETAIAALERHGLGTPPDKKKLDAELKKTIELLRTASYEAPLDAEAALVQLCLLFGAEVEDAKEMAEHLAKGELTYLEQISFGAHHSGTAEIEVDVLAELFSSGKAAKARYTERLAEVTAPFAGTDRDLDAGRSQVFELFREFPDLASTFYAEYRFESLLGFPPQLAEGTGAASAAEATFLADAGAWKDWEETKGYLWTGGYIAAGALLTVGTLGVAGAGAALVVGTGYGVGISAVDVDRAAAEVTKTRDALGVAAASEQTLAYKKNELTGAVGALVINVATVGIGAKLGAGVAAKELTKKLIAKELLVGTALGSATGALTVLVNPNALSDPNLLGLVAKGTVIGGLGALAGSGLGVGAGWAGKKIALSKTQGADGEPKYQAAVEGESAPRNVRDVRELEDGRVAVLLDDGEMISVKITSGEQLSLDPRALAALESDPTPSALLGLASEATPEAPVPTTSRPASANTTSPLLAGILEQMSGKNVADKRAAVLAATEQSPQIKRFVERTGEVGASLVADLGAEKFLAVYANDARPRGLAKLGLGESSTPELSVALGDVLAEQFVLAAAAPNPSSLKSWRLKLEGELRAELKAKLPPNTPEKTINDLAAGVAEKAVLARAIGLGSGERGLQLWTDKPSPQAMAEVAAVMKEAGYPATTVTRESLWAVFDAPLLPQAKELFDSIRAGNLEAIMARDALALVHKGTGLFDTLKNGLGEMSVIVDGQPRSVDEQRHMLLAATAELFYADASAAQINAAAFDAVAAAATSPKGQVPEVAFNAFLKTAKSAWAEKQASAIALGKAQGIGEAESVAIARELSLIRALERRARENGRGGLGVERTYEEDFRALVQSGSGKAALQALQKRRDHLVELMPVEKEQPLSALKDIQAVAQPKGTLKFKPGSTKGYEDTAALLAGLMKRLEANEASAIGGSKYAEFRFPPAALEAAVDGKVKVLAFDGTMDQAIEYARSKLPRDASGKLPGYKRLDLQGLDGSGPRSLVFFDDGTKYLVVSGIGKSRLLHNAGSLALYEGTGGRKITNIEVAGQGTDYQAVMQKDIAKAVAASKDPGLPVQLVIAQNPKDLKTAFGDALQFSDVTIDSLVPMQLATLKLPSGETKRLLVAKVAGNGVYGDTAGTLVQAFFGAGLTNLDPNVVFNGTAGGFSNTGKIGNISPGGMLMPTVSIKEYAASGSFETHAMKTMWGKQIPAATLAKLKEMGVVLTDHHSAVPAPAIETHPFVKELVAISESVDVEGGAMISAIEAVNVARKKAGLSEATFTPIYTHSDDPRASEHISHHDLAHLGPFFEGARFNPTLWKVMGFVLGMSP